MAVDLDEKWFDWLTVLLNLSTLGSVTASKAREFQCTTIVRGKKGISVIVCGCRYLSVCHWMGGSGLSLQGCEVLVNCQFVIYKNSYWIHRIYQLIIIRMCRCTG